MNALGTHPWEPSFSYGRALQDPVLKAWRETPPTSARRRGLFIAAPAVTVRLAAEYTRKRWKNPSHKLFRNLII